MHYCFLLPSYARAAFDCQINLPESQEGVLPEQYCALYLIFPGIQIILSPTMIFYKANVGKNSIGYNVLTEAEDLHVLPVAI